MNPNPKLGQRWHYKYRDEFVSEIVIASNKLANKVLICIKDNTDSNPPGKIFGGAETVIKDFSEYWTLLPNQDNRNEIS